MLQFDNYKDIIFNYDEVVPTDFSIAQFNVLKYNNNYETTIQSAINSNADLVSFQEVDFSWSRALEQKLKQDYPYSFLYPREDCYGYAIYSKTPLMGVSLKKIEGYPYIKGSLLIKDSEVMFISMHTRAPLSKSNFDIRNNQINQLAFETEKIDKPLVIFGDFNSVPWDYSIKQFKKITHLNDSRKNITPTFPAYLSIAGIPIDYIFHSNEIWCNSFKAIGNGNSDHKGVQGYYGFLE